VKSVDGTANPYTVLAGIIGAGMIGVDKGCEVQAKNCVGATTPADMNDEERKQMGIISRMPLSLDEATACLQGDTQLRERLGDDMVETYLALNKALDEEMGLGTETEVVSRLVTTY